MLLLFAAAWLPALASREELSMHELLTRAWSKGGALTHDLKLVGTMFHYYRKPTGVARRDGLHQSLSYVDNGTKAGCATSAEAKLSLLLETSQQKLL